MYLKRLELQGFKSFQGRTLFEFGPGMTAVVGPNGSGKSNVAESIRWVLGEQAGRNLRARRLEDVIFSGSSQKAAVGMAEVSILGRVLASGAGSSKQEAEREAARIALEDMASEAAAAEDA